MINLYGIKNGKRKLVAAFDSEQQLLAYARWATLREEPDGTRKFEQGSVLGGYSGFEHDRDPAARDADVPHNPSPSML